MAEMNQNSAANAIAADQLATDGAAWKPTMPADGKTPALENAPGSPQAPESGNQRVNGTGYGLGFFSDTPVYSNKDDILNALSSLQAGHNVKINGLDVSLAGDGESFTVGDQSMPKENAIQKLLDAAKKLKK